MITIVVIIITITIILNNHYTFPGRTLDVYLDHLELVNSYPHVTIPIDKPAGHR
jgi:hypothetical protein